MERDTSCESMKPSESAVTAVPTHLLVELADVVVGLVLRLEDGGVLLDILRGRHLGGRKFEEITRETRQRESMRELAAGDDEQQGHSLRIATSRIHGWRGGGEWVRLRRECRQRRG